MSSVIHAHAVQLLKLPPWFIKVTSFVCTNRINMLYLKLRPVSNRCKRVLEAAKLACANKTKESITSQKLGFATFSEL